MARILVVEDNPTNQRVVVCMLGKRGHQTAVAANGLEALEALDRGSYDLVLMDVQMPVLDGLETARLIRKDGRWNDLPVVGLTAHAMSEDRERCMAAGMNGYLSKPVTMPALLAAVGEHLPPPEGPEA